MIQRRYLVRQCIGGGDYAVPIVLSPVPLQGKCLLPFLIAGLFIISCSDEERCLQNDSEYVFDLVTEDIRICLLYTSPSPRDRQKSRMPSSA